MKKVLALFLALIICTSFSACGEQESEVLKIGDTASTDAAEFVLTSATVVDSNTIVVDFTIKNIGKEELGFVTYGDGVDSISIDYLVRINYKDGYIIPFDDAIEIKDGKLYRGSPNLHDLEPLTPAGTYRATKVINDIEIDQASGMLLEVVLPTTKTKDQIFIYDISNVSALLAAKNITVN